MNDLELKNLSVAYGQRKIFSDIDLKIRGGSSIAIIGRSGCGKSTLLKIIAGILEPNSGRVLLDGNDLKPSKNVIGFMPQSYGLLPWKTVEENILLAVRIKKKPIDREELNSLIYRLGLFGMEKKFPREISGGQRQRAALARIFLLRPEILLMDEPFSALDAITRSELQTIFLELQRDYKPTTLLVTHDINEAILLGDKILLMTAGRFEFVSHENIRDKLK